MVNPFLGLIFLFWFLLTSGYDTEDVIKLSCLLSALFVGLIQSTKVVENDMIWYIDGYLDAGKYSFIEYIFSFGRNGQGKELSLAVFNYLLYPILGPYPKAYVLILTFIPYCFLNFAVFKFGKALHTPNPYIIAGIFAMCFTPYIFTMSGVIMRQFFASAILMYVLVNNFFYGKKSVILVLIMVFFHSTTLFFVPLIYVPFLKKPISVKFSLLLLGIFLIQPLALFMVSFVEGIPLLKYALERASRNTTFEELGRYPLSKIISTFVLSVLPLVYYYYIKPSMKLNRGFLHFFHVLVILGVFILANTHQSELAHRFTTYTWIFFPFLFMIYLGFFRINSTQLVVFTLLLYAFFILYLEIGMWTYTIGGNLYLYSLIHYF